MKTLCLFPLELRRLLHSRLTWLTALLTMLSPLAGLVFYKPASASTMLSIYLANPAIAGGVAAASCSDCSPCLNWIGRIEAGRRYSWMRQSLP